MYNYVILHGSFGSPFENWFPWAYNTFSEKGSNVLVPQMPCGGSQNYDSWCKVLDAYKNFFNKNTIFICHSLAPAFITNYLIDNNISVNKLIFVAPFYQKLGNDTFDEVNKTFFIDRPLNKIQNLCNKIFCFVSNNDPYVPNSASLNFAKSINAQVITVDNAGHFNSASGYTQFELLLKYL